MSIYKKKLSAFFLMVLFIAVSDISFAQEKKEYLIENYGAISGGKTLNTEAIQKTIDIASANNGGKVIIPKGDYLTGTIEMKSNVELYLDNEARLLGSTNPSDYYKLEMKGRPESIKKDDNSQMALIVAYKADNISISGKGTIDGQGRALALKIDSLHHAGVVVDPHYWGRPNERMRPKLIRLSTCNNVSLSKATFRNSACWGLSFELCENLVIDGITIFNRAYWNNDGIDISDSKNVKVINCDINSADDGICLKSYYPGYANDSIYIANCTIRTSASAIKFGTASFGGFKNVTIENIKIFDTFRSSIAIESVDGGIIENIKVSNIVAKNTGNAIFIRLGHRAGAKPGIVKNIHIKDMKVEVPFGRPDLNYDLRVGTGHHNIIPSSITGIPGHNVENVLLENIEITYPGRASKGQSYFGLSRLDQFPEKIENYPEFSMFGEVPSWGMYVRHATGIEMKNVTLKLNDHDFRPALIFQNVKKIDLQKMMLPENFKHEQIVLKNSSEFSMTPKKEDLLRIIE